MRTSEWFVKRFLLASRRNEREAYDMLKKTMLWRKSMNLANIKPTDFPKEFYEVAGLFSYSYDKQGMPVIYLRIRMHKKIKELADPVQQFLFHTIDRVEQESESNSVVVLFDCNGAGYSNMDIDLLRSLIDVAFKYFPFCIRLVIVYEMSWMLNAFRKIAMSLVPSTISNLVRFANRHDITNYIDVDNLPDFMNGNCKLSYRNIPEDCVSVAEIAETKGLTKKDIEKIMALYEPFLEEARINRQNEENRMLEEQAKSVAKNIELKNEKILAISDQGDDMNEPSTPVALIHSCSKPFGEYASIYPQNLIEFHRVCISNAWKDNGNLDDVRSSLVATVMIRNNHATKPLAFKIQSNNAHRYVVTPSQGVLLSGAFVCIQLTMKETGADCSMAITRDKFLVLMSPEVNPNQHLKNATEFNQLFVVNVSDVYSHKLKVKIENDKMVDEVDNGRKDSNEVIGQLEEKVAKLKKKCRRLESKQQWLNTLSLVFIVVLMVACLYCLALSLDRNGSWTEHIARALPNLVNPLPVSQMKRREL